MPRAKLIVLGVVVLGVGSAAVAGIPAPADVAVTPTQPRDVAAWTMPLDGYVPPSSIAVDYAEDLLVQRCLAGKPGNDYVVPWRDVDAAVRAEDFWDADRSGNDSPPIASTRPLDAGTAATRGYHGASRVDPGLSAWQTWNPDIVGADFDGCLGGARRTLGDAEFLNGHQQTAADVARHLTLVAAEEARKDPAVLAAARRWHTCMVAGDASTVTDVPAQMTAAVVGRFALSVPTSGVSTDETTLATLDLGCQRSSGYRTALYDAEWSRLLHVTAADEAALRQGSRDMAALGDRVDRVIAADAPPRPGS